MLAYCNNQFVPEEEALLPVMDLSIQRGYGVFDFFRTVNLEPLFLDDYLNRFFSSAEGLYLQPTQSKEEIKAIVYQLIHKNGIPDCGIKLILTGGISADGYSIGNIPNLIITQQKLSPVSQQVFSAGVKVITHEHQRELPHIKSINYLMGVWLQQKIKEKQAADVLYFNNGIVSELPRANVFIITYNNRVITPYTNVLQGITRKKVLQLAAKKYATEERAITLLDIENAAEVFMTSTTKKILPITTIDDLIIGEGKAGPITTALHNAFLQLEKQLIR